MFFARLFYALFGASLLASAVVLAFQATDSERVEIVEDLLFGLPVVLLLAGLSFHATARAIRGRTLKRRTAALVYAGFPLAAYATYYLTLLCLVPSSIRYHFSTPGATHSYQKVQIYFRQGGQWLPGPSAEGRPLTVRFPDLNHDGYPDVRIIEAMPDGGEADFVYLPQNDGHSYWRALKNDSDLKAAYPPADYFSNYP